MDFQSSLHTLLSLALQNSGNALSSRRARICRSRVQQGSEFMLCYLRRRRAARIALMPNILAKRLFCTLIEHTQTPAQFSYRSHYTTKLNCTTELNYTTELNRAGTASKGGPAQHGSVWFSSARFGLVQFSLVRPCSHYEVKPNRTVPNRISTITNASLKALLYKKLVCLYFSCFQRIVHETKAFLWSVKRLVDHDIQCFPGGDRCYPLGILF